MYHSLQQLLCSSSGLLRLLPLLLPILSLLLVLLLH
jgi:hypothetical protein